MAFRCNNCGGNMVFDVASQSMRCQHCDSVCAPEDFVVRDQGIAHQTPQIDGFVPSGTAGPSEMVSFTCRSCGAELEATDDSLVGLCPYCGGQSMVRGEATGHAVERMVPFQISKDRCVELYEAYARKVRYLPPEMHDPQQLQKFTGIYLPYWRFDARYGEARISGHKTVVSNSRYDEVESYSVDAQIEGEYGWGAPTDASRYLDDEISARALPYKTDHEKPFNAAYLAGFYADTSTVPAEVYYEDAARQASADLLVDVERELMHARHITMDETSSVQAEVTGHHSMLLPLWFLTWRKGERVAYAVINGDTGKVVSDLPLDTHAFAIGCAIASAVVFALLELLVQPTPLLTSVISLLAAAFMAISITGSARHIYEQALHVNDKGWGQTEGKAIKESWWERFTLKKAGAGGIVAANIMVAVIVFMAGDVLEWLGSTLKFGRTGGIQSILALAIAVLALVVSLGTLRKLVGWRKGLSSAEPVVAAIVLLLSVVLNVAIVAIAPVNDGWYYLGDGLCILGLLFAAVIMIRTYNESTMRPVPKLFDRREVEQ